MTKVFAVANQKGGVAKTTTVIHLGAALAAMGKKVLLVDLDPQGHVAEALGYRGDQLEQEMSDVLDGSKKMAEVIIEAARLNLDIAPSNIRLSDMELSLVNLMFREARVREALEPIKSRYQFVLLDCPPSLGLLTINALMAANQVIIPIAPEILAMLGASLLLNTIQNLKAKAHPSLAVWGIIHTRQTNTRNAREVAERTKLELGKRFYIFEPAIHESTKFKEAMAQGKTVFETAPALQGAEVYQQIAEVMIHGKS